MKKENDTYFRDDLAQTFADLAVGRVYKRMALYPEEADGGMVRVIDGSGEPYLYDRPESEVHQSSRRTIHRHVA